MSGSSPSNVASRVTVALPDDHGVGESVGYVRRNSGGFRRQLRGPEDKKRRLVSVEAWRHVHGDEWRRSTELNGRGATRA